LHTLQFKAMFSSIVLLTLGCWMWGGMAMAQGPSFDCGKVKAGSIEEMICRDDGLAVLDRKLSEVYTAASPKKLPKGFLRLLEAFYLDSR
jgi:uncharacterized protein